MTHSEGLTIERIREKTLLEAHAVCKCVACAAAIEELSFHPAPAPASAMESDSAMLERLGDDGMAWATEFCKRFPISVDDALGWFCNAIEASHDKRTRQAAPPAQSEPVSMGEKYVTDLNAEFNVNVWSRSRTEWQADLVGKDIYAVDSSPGKAIERLGDYIIRRENKAVLRKESRGD